MILLQHNILSSVSQQIFNDFKNENNNIMKISILVLYLTLVLMWTNGIAQTQSKLKIHGYLTQGFAITDGHQIYGITKKGTTDYRNLALQFRFDINERNSGVVQISHRRIGSSPLMEIETDVSLDWAFFEHRFNEVFGFKAGKILIPFGLHNEVQDVGVVLPFYRVPFIPYSNGNFMSETFDGLSIFYSFHAFDNWIVDLEIYGGNWNWIAWASLTHPVTREQVILIELADINNGMGAQTRITTPFDALNIGASWQNGFVKGGLFFGRENDGIRAQTYNMINLFADVTFQYFYFQPEYVKTFFRQGDFTLEGASFQAGINLNEKLTFNFSAEYLDLYNVPDYESATSDVVERRRDSNYLRDFGIGLSYKFTSSVVLKAETHWNKSLAIEERYIHVFEDKPVNTKYAIISLSTSF